MTTGFEVSMAGKMQQHILPAVVTFWSFKEPNTEESEVLSHRTNLRRKSNQRLTQQLRQSTHTDRAGCKQAFPNTQTADLNPRHIIPRWHFWINTLNFPTGL